MNSFSAVNTYFLMLCSLSKIIMIHFMYSCWYFCGYIKFSILFRSIEIYKCRIAILKIKRCTKIRKLETNVTFWNNYFQVFKNNLINLCHYSTTRMLISLNNFSIINQIFYKWTEFIPYFLISKLKIANSA